MLERFRFKLKNNYKNIFNYKIIVNIFYLDNYLTLYIINIAISF